MTQPTAPLINLERRRVDELLADPRNARLHSTRNLDTIRASLRQFGQQKNLVILPSGVVIAGSGTLAAAAAEGWESLDVKVFTGTLDEARAFGVVDNRSAELASWDDDALADALREQSDLGLDLDALGWTDDELAKMLGDPSDDGGSGDPALGPMEYRIVVECRDEDQQRDVLTRLEALGVECRAVMS